MGILFLISTLQICSDSLSRSVAWLTPLLKQMLPTDTEDTEDTATWVTLDTAALLHMLTPLDPTSPTLSSMCPMVTLLPASTVLLTLVLFTLLRGLLTLTLSTDTEDTDTPDLLPLDSPLCPMPASPFRDMLRDTDTDCGRCQDMGIHYLKLKAASWVCASVRLSVCACVTFFSKNFLKRS